MFRRLLCSVAVLAVSAATQVQLPSGVNLPAPDEDGWIRIFSGSQDADNFYVIDGTNRFVPALARKTFPNNNHFTITGDTIRVAGAGKSNAHFVFKQELSHHRVRFQMRWPGNLGNTGILMKVQEHDTTQSQGFPRSIEFQGDPLQGIGQIWALGSIRDPGGQMRNGGTWVTFRGNTRSHPSGWATSGFCSGQNGGQMPLAAQYDSTAAEINFGGGGDPCNNLIVGGPGWQYPRPPAIHTGTAWRSNTDWVTVEVDTRGHEVTTHYVEGQVVLQYHSPRIAARDNAFAIQKMLTSGLMAWQSEGSNVWFRNLEIKLHPEDPLYPQLYPSSVRPAPSATAEVGGGRPHILMERGFPVMVTRDGKRVSLTGRRL